MYSDLCDAILGFHYEEAKQLISNPNLNINHVFDINDNFSEIGDTTLLLASRMLLPEIVRFILISRPEVDINYVGRLYDNILLAVYDDDFTNDLTEDEIKSLITEISCFIISNRKDINFDHSDKRGRTALMYASENELLGVVECFLTHRDDINIDAVDIRGETALTLTTSSKIKDLLNEYKKFQEKDYIFEQYQSMFYPSRKREAVLGTLSVYDNSKTQLSRLPYEVLNEVLRF